jgi:hypothetical protein
MAQFFGTLQGQRGEASRLGTKSSGLQTEACSWQGKVVVRMWHDPTDGHDKYDVYLRPHHGAGVSQTLVHDAVVGAPYGDGSV